MRINRKVKAAQPRPMDLNVIMNEVMGDMSRSGFVKKVMTEKLQITINEIIRDLFREYGPFGKQLKKHLEEKLQINFGELDLVSYNTIVLQEVQKMLDQGIKVAGLEKLKDMMQKMISETKPEYKLSELVEELKKYAIQYVERDDSEEIGMIIDREFSMTTYIYLDPTGEQDNKYRYKYGFGVNTQDGTVRYVNIDGKTLDNKMVMSGLHGFEELLFRLFASGSKVEIDEDEVDLYYPEDGERD